MENTDYGFLLLLCGVFCLFFLGGFIKYLADYFADVRYVKREINRAYSWNEYVYWKRELSALRWSILPGLTPKG